MIVGLLPVTLGNVNSLQYISSILSDTSEPSEYFTLKPSYWNDLPKVPEAVAVWLFMRSKEMLLPLNMPSMPDPIFTFTSPSDEHSLESIAEKGWGELHNQLPPAWNEKFGNRLEVIQFDYVKGLNHGKSRGVNKPETVCEKVQPLHVCQDFGMNSCHALVRNVGKRASCSEWCEHRGTRCHSAYDDFDQSCPQVINSIGCEEAHVVAVCVCGP
jgi:hypothetical protein